MTEKSKSKLVPKSKVRKVDWSKVKSHPEYKKFNWKINPDNLSIILDSLINRNADLPEQVAIFSLVIPENGGNTSAHGNGAFGLVGWRGSRALNLSNDLPSQIHKLMEETYSNPKAKDWSHGGSGMGISNGKEMYGFFKKTPVVRKAVNAFMRGYVRPPKEVYDLRLSFANFLSLFFK